jgi:hypothetical protein
MYKWQKELPGNTKVASELRVMELQVVSSRPISTSWSHEYCPAQMQIPEILRASSLQILFSEPRITFPQLSHRRVSSVKEVHPPTSAYQGRTGPFSLLKQLWRPAIKAEEGL